MSNFPYPAALEIIKKWEGCKLTAYQDSVKVWTIGYGHTKGVKKGDKITQEQAEAWLLEELSGEYLPDLRRALGDDVFYKLNSNQVSALLSFIYNLGAANFRSSTLRKKLIMGDYKGAANEFPRWNRAGGKVLKGLTNRRLDEQKLFLKS